MRYLTLALLAALAAAPALPAQGRRDRDRDREKQREMRDERDRDRDEDDADEYASRLDTTLALNRGGTVDLSLVSGEMIVHAWPRDEVKIHATSEHGTLRLDASPSRVSLDVRSYHGRMGDTRFELNVPVGARLLLRSISGEIEATGSKGEVEAHSVSGDIHVEDAAQRVSLESVSGGVRARRLAGDVRVNAVSGDLDVDGVNGDLEAETVSGEVQLQNVQSKYVRVETVSGTVEYQGSADASGRYEFHSHSGDLRLTLPRGAGAVFNVETFSGSLDSDTPITLEPRDDERGARPKRFSFTVGGGGARIIAETFSGDITIQHGGR